MPNSRKKLRISARHLAPALLAVGLLGVASCSEVLDDVTGYFEDDEANDRAIEQAEGEQDFPKLSDVPEAPRPASTTEDLDRLGEGLVADRDEARYTNETLRSRYADDEPIVSESTVASAAAPEPAPQQQAIQSEELQPAELAEQRRVAATETTVARSASSLAEDRRVSNIEPASEAVLRDRQTGTAEARRIAGSGERQVYGDDGSLAESRRVASGQTVRQVEPGETGGLRETRVAAARQASAGSGVLTISEFRSMFNDRFDSSGRSPYRPGERQQAAAQVGDDVLARDRALSPGSSDMVSAQLEQPALTPPSTGRAGGATDQAAVLFQAASIPFAVGSASLNASDRGALKNVVKLHRKFGGTVHVVGHSSRRTRDMGSETHRLVNFNLSLDRATAVSMELARLGVPAEAVTVIARSDNEPLAYEYMPEGESFNRRADVYLEY